MQAEDMRRLSSDEGPAIPRRRIIGKTCTGQIAYRQPKRQKLVHKLNEKPDGSGGNSKLLEDAAGGSETSSHPHGAVHSLTETGSSAEKGCRREERR